MFSFNTMTLLHRHGDDWMPLTAEDEEQHSSPDEHDPERQMLHGERVFRCPDCDEEVRVRPLDRG